MKQRIVRVVLLALPILAALAAAAPRIRGY